MIDIFQQPDLFIADVTVSIDGNKIPFKVYLSERRVKKIDDIGKIVPTRISQTVKRLPVLLLNGDMPSDTCRRRFIDKHFTRLPKGEYPYEVEFSNVKFSSRIQYYFDL